MSRVNPSFYRGRHIEPGACPIGQREFATKQIANVAGQGDDDMILRGVRGIHDDRWSNLNAG